MLWVNGITEYRPRDSVAAQCARLAARPLIGVSQAMRSDGAAGWAELQSLYEDIEALAEMANSE